MVEMIANLPPGSEPVFRRYGRFLRGADSSPGWALMHLEDLLRPHPFPQTASRGLATELSFLRNFDAGRSSRALFEQPLRFLTYNVWGVPWHSSKRHLLRFECILEQLGRRAFDVVCLQEVWVKRGRLFQNHRRFPFHAVSRKRLGLFQHDGLLTLSRHPIIESQSLPFSTRASVERVVRKGALFTRIMTPLGELEVFNVHLASTSHFLSESYASEIRASQIEELSRWVRMLHRKGSTVLVCGDFNIDAQSELYPELVHRFGMDTIYEYRCSQDRMPSQTEKKHADPRFTFDPAQNPWARNCCGRPLRIDYFFVKPNQQQGFFFRSHHRFSEPIFRGRPPSDHYAVELELVPLHPNAIQQASDPVDVWPRKEIVDDSKHLSRSNTVNRHLSTL